LKQLGKIFNDGSKKNLIKIIHKALQPGGYFALNGFEFESENTGNSGYEKRLYQSNIYISLNIYHLNSNSKQTDIKNTEKSLYLL
jgi:hypothetical protein